jgi:protein TonB
VLVPVRIQVEMFFAVRDGEPPPKGPPLDSPDVYKPSANIKPPRILSEVKPQYTAEAMRAGAQGIVRLECVILPDGTIGAIRVNEGIHPGLDREAVRALRKWRFIPGFKDEVAVPVQVEVEMTFTLRSTPRKPGGEL